MDNLVLIASKPEYHLQNGLDHCFQRMKSTVVKVNESETALRAKYMEGNNTLGVPVEEGGHADSREQHHPSTDHTEDAGRHANRPELSL